MMENPPANFDSTKYYPVYFLLDQDTLPPDGYFQLLLDALAETEKGDFVVVDRSQIEPKGGGKGAPKKGGKGEVEEEEEDATVTIVEGMTAALTEHLDKEIVTKQKELYDSRKAFLDSLGKAGSGSDAAAKKPAKGSASRPETSEGQIGDKLDGQQQLPTYPEKLPLHVLLTDVVRKPGDVEELKKDGIEISGICYFKPHTERKRGQDEGEDEFTYRPLTHREEQEEVEQEEEEQPGEAKVEEEETKEEESKQPTLLQQLISLRDTVQGFRNLHIFHLFLPDPEIGTQLLAEEPVADASAEAAKGKPKSAKGKGGKAEASPEEAMKQRWAGILSAELEVSVRRMSSLKEDFSVWSANASVQAMPQALPASEVDMRLYDSLLEKVPGTCTTVPVLLHCLFEQVAITANGADLGQMFTDERAEGLGAFLDGTLASVLDEDLVEEAEIDAAVQQQDNAGGPCLFKNGICTACGQPEFDEDIMSEGEVDDFDDDMQQVDQVSNDEFCSATIGEPCNFVGGRCTNCFALLEDRNIVAPSPELFCPATLGELCVFEEGQCVNCGQIDDRVEGNGLILPSDSIHPNYKNGEVAVEFDVESNSNYCPATMGELCNYRAGVCTNCGAAASGSRPVSAKSNRAAPAAQQQMGRPLSSPKLCHAQMGAPCQFEGDRCVYCGVLRPGAKGEQSAPRVQADNERDDFSPTFKMNMAGNYHSASKTSLRSDRSTMFCPASLGGMCELNGSNVCVNCGQVDRAAPPVREQRICPATIGAPKAAVTTVVLKHGNATDITQAKDCLLLGKQWTEFPSKAMEVAAVQKHLPLPGVCRLGMPTTKTKTVADRGIEKTSLLNRSELPANIFEFGLLTLTVEEMLANPAPSFHYTRQNHTEFFHVDHLYKEAIPVEAAVEVRLEEIRKAIKVRKVRLEEGISEEELNKELNHLVQIALLPSQSKTKLMSRLKKTPVDANPPKTGSKSAKGPGDAPEEPTEEKEGEQTVDTSSLITTGPVKGDEGIWIGEEDEEVEEARIKWNWKVREREYREELSRDVLPQVLSRALLDPTNTSHVQARYEPLDDTLVVTCHSRTPLTRERTIKFENYINPNLNFRIWNTSSLKVQTKPADVLYDFPNGHEGELKRVMNVMYPRDGGKLGLDTVSSGRKKYPRLFIQKDDNLIYMQPNRNAQPIIGPSRTTNEEVPNVVNAFFPDQSLVSITYVESSEEGQERTLKPVIGFTSPNGMVIQITHDGKVYMQYPSAIVPDKPKEEAAPVGEVGEDTQTCETSGTSPEGEDSAGATKPSTPDVSTAEGKKDGEDDGEGEGDEQQVEGTSRTTQSEKKMPQIKIRPSVRTEESLGFSSQGEVWRCIQPNGVVLKKMTNGVTHMLMPDANVSTFDPEAKAWVITNNDGSKVVKYDDNRCKELKQIQVATQYDPESGANVTTREDLAMYVQYRSGSSVAQLSDATRIYTDVFSEQKKRFVVECPEFPAVSMDVEKVLKLDDSAARAPKAGMTGRNLKSLERARGDAVMDDGPANVKEINNVNIEISLSDGTVIKKSSPQGSVTVIRRDGSRMVACPQGKIVYASKSQMPETLPLSLIGGEYEEFAIPKECYTIDVCAGKISIQDLEENVFDVSLNGNKTCRLSRDEGLEPENRMDAKYYPPPANPNLPRVFVVRSDGTGFELLSEETMEEYNREVAVNSNARILPVEKLTGPVGDEDEDEISEEGQQEPEGVSVPVSIKYLETLTNPLGYNREIILPNCIKATPSGVSSEPKPNTKYVVYRHLIRFPALTEEMYNTVKRDKAAYENSKLEQLQADLDFEVDDVRSKEEKDEEERLALEVLTARTRRKEKAMQEALQQHEAVAQLTARDEMVPTQESLNLTSTITPTYDPPKKIPVTSTPFTEMQQDGERAPVKFFSKKPGSKITKAKVATGAPLNARTLVRGEAIPETELEPDFGSFFQNPTFDQRFGLASIFMDMELSTHPLYREGQTPAELAASMQTLTAAEMESVKDTHMQELRGVVEGVRQVLSCVNRIFMRPHDPTLRTIAMGQPPYKSIIQGTKGLPRFAEPILNAIGFETKSSGSNGVLVQMRDDLYLKDGIASLVQHLKIVSSGEGPVASYGTKIAERPKSARMADSSDEEDEEQANKLDDYDRPESAQELSLEKREREARFKASSQYPAVHEPFGKSFVHQPQYAPPPDMAPKQFARTFESTSGSLTVTGSPRRAMPPLPQNMLPAAGGELNLRYVSREAAVKRKIRTTSTVRAVETDPTASFADFMIHPAQVNMGTLLKGSTYRVTCTMTNVGYGIAKFAIKQPAPEAGSAMFLKTLFRPGDIAPGMKKRLEVQLFAGSLGNYTSYIQIRTEKAVFNLPVTANVVNELPPSKKTGRRPNSPFVPPLPSAGKFGTTGKVRLHSEMPSPNTSLFLSRMEGRPGSGGRPPSQSGSRPGSRPGTGRRSRPISRGSAREPTIPTIDSKYSIDPNRTLNEIVGNRS
mmetsp:Transcript_6892/g.13017  ORF Transcript_6892/g.13017 Transcript_6892/m.13017 type:complete len:2473 (+) Transcript_6892:108-7526(+)